MRTRVFAVIRRIVAIAASFVLVASCSCSDSDDSSGQDVSGDGGRCVGTPAPCESFSDPDACSRQGGCDYVWYYYRCLPNMPTGPTACEILSGREDVCLGQVGCSWVE